MNSKTWITIAFALILSTAAAPLWAHHGDAGRYNEDLVTLNGSIVELQMINPHSIIVIDVPDPKGKVIRWQAEMGGPNALSRGFGWTRNTLKPGDKVTLVGRRVKSGAPYMNLTERAFVYMTDSKKLLFRTANAELPPGVVVPAGMGAAEAPAPAPAPGAAAPAAGGAAY
jgi:Family of unknown function (DUF6152)